MKAVTLVALIGISLEVVAGIYFSLIRFKAINYDATIAEIMSSCFLLGSIGLLIFFIRLFQKQSN